MLEIVVYKGVQDNFCEIIKYYGEERFRKEIIKSKSLRPKEVNFCWLIFDLKPADFKHYEGGQFRAYPEFKDPPEDFYYENLAG